uniref:Uncharacterized protein n=1 Tax=Podoviridae sp. ctaNW81 TaxID=2826562 RepID=A0A8S5M5Q1_9CAUD|nr:MAG TPA: hypothetical protein [Podoviridae sp. ctaNW81]
MRVKLRLPRTTIDTIRILSAHCTPSDVINAIYDWYDKQGELDILTIPAVGSQSQEAGWLTVDITSSLYYRLTDDLPACDNRGSPARLITFFVENELYEDDTFAETLYDIKQADPTTSSIDTRVSQHCRDILISCRKILTIKYDRQLYKIVKELEDYARQHT